MAADTLPPPAWMYDREGRLVPLDGDRIAAALFDATERLGAPDVFLARELTEAVLHFLALECDGTAVRAEQVEEMIRKVVRELGHPALARAFASLNLGEREATPRAARERDDAAALSEVIDAALTAYSERVVFSRDVVAARRSGLLEILDLQHPGKLWATAAAAPTVAGPPHAAMLDLLAPLHEAGRLASCFVVLDGFEDLLIAAGADSASAVTEVLDWLDLCVAVTARQAFLNVNCPDPPSWAGGHDQGPLFACAGEDDRSSQLQAVRNHLLTAWAAKAPTNLWLNVHLSAADFAAKHGRIRAPEALLRLARACLLRRNILISFDRQRRDPLLGPGVSRRRPTAVACVRVNLDRLAEYLSGGSFDLFLRKLTGLAHLAVAAARQKKAFLREASRAGGSAAGNLTRGFLLDRARLVVIAGGVDSLARNGAPGDGARRARAAVAHLTAAVRGAGERAGVETLVVCGGVIPGDKTSAVGGPVLSAEAQVRQAQELHREADLAGAIVAAGPSQPAAEEIAALIHLAWKETSLQTLYFRPSGDWQPGFPELEG